MAVQTRLLSHYVFQIHAVWLLNFQKCSEIAPILDSVICSDMNTASITTSCIILYVVFYVF